MEDRLTDRILAIHDSLQRRETLQWMAEPLGTGSRLRAYHVAQAHVRATIEAERAARRGKVSDEQAPIQAGSLNAIAATLRAFAQRIEHVELAAFLRSLDELPEEGQTELEGQALLLHAALIETGLLVPGDCCDGCEPGLEAAVDDVPQEDLDQLAYDRALTGFVARTAGAEN